MSSAEPRPQVNIREMREEDIEGVLAIDRKTIGSQRALTFADDPESYIVGELEASIVAEAHGQIVGFLLGQIGESTFGEGGVSWVRLIGVDPDYHHQGIGHALMVAFTERCRQKGARSVRIMVRWHDWWLLSFLKSQGFDRGEMAEFVKPII